MNVFLTFDIEVWCNGWGNLDNAFPSSFERYVYGRSAHGDYALPQILAILNQHGLKGVFFVEPLFATRFGAEHLETIVQLIRGAGQEIQLHLHTEWSDEARQPIIKNNSSKRQHLNHYTLDEQTTLIGHGKKMLEDAGSGSICAFRAGSYAVNRDTFTALSRNQIYLDSSLNSCFAVSGPDMRSSFDFTKAILLDGVTVRPATVMTDGFGNDRPIQVGACSFEEIRDALVSAKLAKRRDFTIVSHNFEMLKQGSSEPDWVVVKRFMRLCAFLAQHPEKFVVRGFANDLRQESGSSEAQQQPSATWHATTKRYAEQFARRMVR